MLSQVRATSHKPDEIYGIIERLSPGTRKVELFGRPHNVQPNWYILHTSFLFVYFSSGLSKRELSFIFNLQCLLQLNLFPKDAQIWWGFFSPGHFCSFCEGLREPKT